LSTLRHLLEPGIGRGQSAFIVRDGDAYRLFVPEDADVDVLTFDRGVARARAARATGDTDAALDGYAAALSCYSGELLPEEGPAEWVVKQRDRYRIEAADAAGAVAEVLAKKGDDIGVIDVCGRGLAIDRYRDGLWRTLIETYERLGDQGAAARARGDYQAVLAELGIDAPAGLPVSG